MISDEADDLNAEAEADTEGAEVTEGKAPAQASPVASPEGKPAEGQPGDKAAEGKPSGKTIATGAEESEAEAGKAPKVDPNELTDDLRKLIAAHYAAGDKKIEAKELKRLERVKDIKSLWGSFRELESRFTSGGLVKIPGKDAKPEDVKALHTALGVPEKPEDYLKDIKLENGAVIGDADKPIVDTFTQAVHKVGATPAVVSAALSWYYQRQEEIAAEREEQDDTFKGKAMETLKEEFGPALKREINLTSSLFAEMPGGANPKNEQSFYANLTGGRMADGTRIGDHPDFMRWLISIRRDVNPAASVVEDGRSGGKSLDEEIAAIEKIMRENRREYDQKHAGRYLELLQTRDKIQARQGA